jgi:hypothetical protein
MWWSDWLKIAKCLYSAKNCEVISTVHASTWAWIYLARIACGTSYLLIALGHWKALYWRSKPGESRLPGQGCLKSILIAYHQMSRAFKIVINEFLLRETGNRKKKNHTWRSRHVVNFLFQNVSSSVQDSAAQLHMWSVLGLSNQSTQRGPTTPLLPSNPGFHPTYIWERKDTECDNENQKMLLQVYPAKAQTPLLPSKARHHPTGNTTTYPPSPIPLITLLHPVPILLFPAPFQHQIWDKRKEHWCW